MHDQGCLTFLKAFGNVNYPLLADFHTTIRSYPLVQKTSNGMNIRNMHLSDFGDVTMVERWLEADLTSGMNICWWLEVALRDDGAAKIESCVYIRDGDTLRSFPDREVSDFGDLGKELASAALELTQSVEETPELSALLR